MLLTSPTVLTRAHIRLLGLSQVAHIPPPDAEHSLSTVVIESLARQALVRRLYLSGNTQWGVAFGQRREGALHIHHFAPHAPAWAEPTRSPYTSWDTRYLLGYSDALVVEHGGRIDWHGIWRVAPDSRNPGRQDALDWVMAAAQQGLCDDRSPLLTAGWEDGVLTAHAYRLLDDQPFEIPVHIL